MTKNKYAWHIMFRLISGWSAPSLTVKLTDRDNDTQWYEMVVMEKLMR